MVQQVSDAKFTEYGLASNGGAVGPTSDRQQPVVSGKKVALRDLQNDNRNISLGESSPLPTKDKDPRNKKQKSDCLSPLNQQFCNNNAANRHLVYVRRKSEQESGNTNNCNSGGEGESPSRIRDRENQDLGGQKNHSQGPKNFPVPLVTYSSGEPSLPHSLGKLGSVAGIVEPYQTFVSPAMFSTQVNHQKTGSQHWKERFVRLQMYLKKCDQSNQEDYIQALRGLSAVGRSRHAVDLEKRAIHLLLEEGKELHRMKVLNVLGRAAPKKFGSPATKPHSLQAFPEK